MQPIFNLMKPTTAEFTHTKRGRDVLISHIQYLRNSKETITINIDAYDARRYNYSLFAYLRSISVDVKIHWIVMLLNNFDSPEDFTFKTKTILVPSITEVENILTVADL